jgi:probable phosphoglycerate mutase
MVIERLKILLKRLAQEGEPTIAVCHKGIIRALLSLATDWPMLGKQPVRLDWSSLHCFELAKDGTPKLERINISLLPAKAAP